MRIAAEDTVIVKRSCAPARTILSPARCALASLKKRRDGYPTSKATLCSRSPQRTDRSTRAPQRALLERARRARRWHRPDADGDTLSYSAVTPGAANCRLSKTPRRRSEYQSEAVVPIQQALSIKRHDTSDVVELSDGSTWRIWPADVAATLGWLPTTRLKVVAVDHVLCSHALVSQADGMKVKAKDGRDPWPAHPVRQALAQG
jgi:hypothetical protein